MVATKVRQVKIKCIEYECWSLNYGIRNKIIIGHETLTNKFTNSILEETNQNKKIKGASEGDEIKNFKKWIKKPKQK